MRELREAWHRFWFTPQPTSTLAVVRIAFGIVLTLSTLTLAPDLDAFFFGDAVFAEHPVRDWTPSVLRVFTSDAAVVVLYLLLLVSALAIIIGYRAQLAAAVASLALYSFQARNFFVFNAGDELLQIIALYLVFAPSGTALSLDRWRHRRSEFWEFPLRQPWALRLIQIQISVIYFFTFISKVRGDTWYHGTAVSYAQRLEYLQRFPPSESLNVSLLFTNLATYGTLVVEFSLAVLVWNRKLRPWVLLLGVALHLVIDITIVIGFFSILMLALYLAFVPAETMSRFLLSLRDRWRRRRSPQPGLPCPAEEEDADLLPEPAEVAGQPEVLEARPRAGGPETPTTPPPR